MSQIQSFCRYNGSKDFQTESNYHPTFILDDKENNPRSSIGVRKLKSHRTDCQKPSNTRPGSSVRPSCQFDHYDLNTLTSTVTNMLGVKRFEDWILNLNIGNVMHLSPLRLVEMNLQLDNSHELTRDAILEKVVLLSIAYF